MKENRRGRLRKTLSRKRMVQDRKNWIARAKQPSLNECGQEARAKILINERSTGSLFVLGVRSRTRLSKRAKGRRGYSHDIASPHSEPSQHRFREGQDGNAPSLMI